MRFLHFADLHLDTQFAWAEPRVAARRRQALRDALVSIIQLALESRVDALLCAGDLYEQERFSPDTAAFLRAAFERANPLPIYITPGNHDWHGPASLYSIVRWSSNVKVFDTDHLTAVTLADGLTLWGAANRAPATTIGFLDNFKVDRGGIHIGLFHGSEQSSLILQGQGKGVYAPFAAAQIRASGLTHALVGHYHAPLDAESFTYPGNPEPLSFGETGHRGPVIVTVDANGGITRERRVVAKTLVQDVMVDVTGSVSNQDIRYRVSKRLSGVMGTVRLTVAGDVEPDVETNLEGLVDLAPQLDALVVRARNLRPGYDLERLKSELTIRGEFVREVSNADLPNELKQKVLVTGLRALDGRQDLDIG